MHCTLYTITERVHNLYHLQSSNDAASVHSIVHVLYMSPVDYLGPRGFGLWTRAGVEVVNTFLIFSFSDFLILDHLHDSIPPCVFSLARGEMTRNCALFDVFSVQLSLGSFCDFAPIRHTEDI